MSTVIGSPNVTNNNNKLYAVGFINDGINMKLVAREDGGKGIKITSDEVINVVEKDWPIEGKYNFLGGNKDEDANKEPAKKFLRDFISNKSGSMITTNINVVSQEQINEETKEKFFKERESSYSNFINGLIPLDSNYRNPNYMSFLETRPLLYKDYLKAQERAFDESLIKGIKIIETMRQLLYEQQEMGKHELIMNKNNVEFIYFLEQQKIFFDKEYNDFNYSNPRLPPGAGSQPPRALPPPRGPPGAPLRGPPPSGAPPRPTGPGAVSPQLTQEQSQSQQQQLQSQQQSQQQLQSQTQSQQRQQQQQQLQSQSQQRQRQRRQPAPIESLENDYFKINIERVLIDVITSEFTSKYFRGKEINDINLINQVQDITEISNLSEGELIFFRPTSISTSYYPAIIVKNDKIENRFIVLYNSFMGIKRQPVEYTNAFLPNPDTPITKHFQNKISKTEITGGGNITNHYFKEQKKSLDNPVQQSKRRMKRIRNTLKKRRGSRHNR